MLSGARFLLLLFYVGRTHRKAILVQNIFMLSIKKVGCRLIVLLFAVACALFAMTGSTTVCDHEIYLGGFPAGFVLETSTVEVVGMCEVMTDSGLKCPARESGLKTGDIVTDVNGNAVDSSESLTQALEGLKLAIITVERDSERLTFEVKPVKDVTSGKTRIGVLVRDSLSGVGTVTYIDKTAEKFASLGHPVTDSSGKLTKINGGTLYGCVIYDVKRGVRGTPGELKGAFESGKPIGEAALNSKCGVFGNLHREYNTNGLTRIELGGIDEVTPGKAKIYSTVSANKTMSYDISIVKVDKTNRENKNFVIKVDDKDLIDRTGGIVQGMSGSPIVQNGKLVGAVTHVFINDATRGYGIAIENMLNAY